MCTRLQVQQVSLCHFLTQSELYARAMHMIA